MLWHIVTFRFSPDAVTADRDALVAALRALPGDIAELRFLRVAPSVDDPDVLGLLTGFDDEAALRTYTTHPAHLPVLTMAGRLCEDIARLDLVTDDLPDALPRT